MSAVKLRIMRGEKCKCGCEVKHYGIQIAKLFMINWFRECGDWFLYFKTYNHYIRFSSAGFMHGKLGTGTR